MKEATKLSPAVENRKGIDKDSDVSKANGRILAHGELDAFVPVYIDARLLRALIGFYTARYTGEEFNIVEEIHKELFQDLESHLDFYHCEESKNYSDFNEWYPDRSVFEELPKTTQFWSLKTCDLEDLTGDILKPDSIPKFGKTDEDYSREHKEWEEKSEIELSEFADRGFELEFHLHKNRSEKADEVFPIVNDAKSRIEEILGSKK